MKRTVLTLVAGAVLCSTVPLFASENPRPVINQRQQNQRARILNGIRSGELNRQEARRLAAGQAHIRVVERRVQRDDEVTARERVRLQRELNQSNRRISRQTHDNQDRN